MKTLKLPDLVGRAPFRPVPLLQRMCWHAHSLKDWRNCKRLWYWRHVWQLQPKKPITPLFIGTAFHTGMARWYGSKLPMKKIVYPLIKEFEDQAIKYRELYTEEDFDDLQIEIRALGGMLRGYAKMFAEDRRTWPLSMRRVEVPFFVKGSQCDAGGTIDLVIDDPNSPLIFEHKTAGRIDSDYVDRIGMDTQVRMYILGARKGLEVPAKRVMYNVARKCQLRMKKGETLPHFLDRITDDYCARPDWYFWREPLIISTSDINAFQILIHEVDSEYHHILTDHKGDMFNPHFWPPNDFMCNARGLCPYRALCTTGLDRGTGRWFRQQKPGRIRNE